MIFAWGKNFIAKNKKTIDIMNIIFKIVVCMVVVGLLLNNKILGNIGTIERLGFGWGIDCKLNSLKIVFIPIVATLIWIFKDKITFRAPKLILVIKCILLITSPIILFTVVEMCWNEKRTEIQTTYIVLNIFMYAILEIAALLLLTRDSLGLRFLYVLSFALGTANSYVYQFRGKPILPTDILDAGTAMRVAENYQYNLTDGMAWGLLITYIMWCILSVKPQYKHITLKRSQKIGFRFLTLIILIVSVTVGFYRIDLTEKFHVVEEYWSMWGAYENAGFLPAFVACLQDISPQKPDGYSTEKAEVILEEAKSDDILKQSDTVKPTIIAIMNEAFSDISVLGDVNCVKDNLKNFYALQSDAGTLEWGYDYVSTRGGGTSTTEFEFLTGNSMAYMRGVNPYPLYNFQEVPNIAATLKKNGYYNIAMHPEKGSNYNRNSVYREMGFDEFVTIDDFESQRVVRDNVISDFDDYKKIIDIYNAKHNDNNESPLFIFNVTMQNHSPYLLENTSEEWKVAVDDKYKEYDDFVAYESSIKAADAALKELIDYFANEHDPVIICFFGDHQPELSKSFEQQLRNDSDVSDSQQIDYNQKQYIVPYFIWCNYDINVDYSYSNEDGIDLISTNYLGSELLAYSQNKLSEYDLFRLRQRASIPVMNFVAYSDTSGKWFSYKEHTEYEELLQQYQIVQFYSLFENKKKQYN